MKKILCFTASVLIILLQAACSDGSKEDASGEIDVTPKAVDDRFSTVEIKEYDGIKLDPSGELRENSISGIQNVDMNNYFLKVSGLVEKPVSMTYDDVLSLTAYEKLITLHCVEGWDATILWKGAALKDIIDTAGADKTANTVIFHSVDKYTTSLPLKTIMDKNMILAYSSNNIVLPASLGFPFIVVAEDKLGYKWARWVNEIELSDDPDYKGYWESTGYDNEADAPDLD